MSNNTFNTEADNFYCPALDERIPEEYFTDEDYEDYAELCRIMGEGPDAYPAEECFKRKSEFYNKHYAAPWKPHMPSMVGNELCRHHVPYGLRLKLAKLYQLIFDD